MLPKLILFVCVAQVLSISYHDRILINSNIFNHPARRLWAFSVLPKGFFRNSFRSRCIYDQKSVDDSIYSLDKILKGLPKFDSLDVEACGRTSTVPRIVGGSVAERKTWKFAVALLLKKDRSLHCGGTIVSKRFVLTAAHCTFGLSNDVQRFVVSIGEFDLSTQMDEFRRTMEVDRIVNHKEYIGSNDGFRNDIALLKTKGEIFFNDYVGPICLPPIARRTNFYDEQALVAGWGRTGKSLSSKTSSILLRTWVPVSSPETCWEELKRNESFFDGYICAGGSDSGSDSCYGDSGGPLVVADPKTLRIIQIGIVSFSYNPFCGEGKPAIYTKLDRYTSWILENTI